MRYYTTTKPPKPIITDYGISVEHAPPVHVDRTLPTGEEAAVKASRDIRSFVNLGHTGVTLRDVANIDEEAGETIDERRGWWEAFGKTLPNVLRSVEDRLHAVAIDHARYDTWRDERQWQYDTFVLPLRAVVARVGMYGTHKRSPTVWMPTPTYIFHGHGEHEYAPSHLGWLIMPGQHRKNHGIPTTGELVSAIEYIRLSGIDTAIVWSDPGNDDQGNPKTRPQDWHAFLTAAVLCSGRPLVVPTYEPPSWVPIDPPADPEPWPPKTMHEDDATMYETKPMTPVRNAPNVFGPENGGLR